MPAIAALLVVAIFATLDSSQIAVALIAAIASLVNTMILLRARQVQGEIKEQVKSLRDDITELDSLSHERDRHIEQLRFLARQRARDIDRLTDIESKLTNVVNRFRGGIN